MSPVDLGPKPAPAEKVRSFLKQDGQQAIQRGRKREIRHKRQESVTAF